MKIGHIVETPAEYDEEGNEVTPPVLSDTYAVDVIWQGEPLEAWDAEYDLVSAYGRFSIGRY